MRAVCAMIELKAVIVDKLLKISVLYFVLKIENGFYKIENFLDGERKDFFYEASTNNSAIFVASDEVNDAK